jgi:hypothetical protein
MSDFYEEAAKQRLETLEAAKMRALAELAEQKACNDTYSAAETVQTIATLEDQRQSLLRLHQQHVAAQNPPAPLPENDQEWLHKAPEKMSYNDVARIMSKSKYGFDDAAFRAGIQEVARRRARGE